VFLGPWSMLGSLAGSSRNASKPKIWLEIAPRIFCVADTCILHNVLCKPRHELCFGLSIQFILGHLFKASSGRIMRPIEQ
jgi:hypothetical protein